MSTTTVPTATSRLLCGFARADITPPIGIYHRMWGAASHHQATGIHRPLLADLLVLGALDGSAPLLVYAYLDMVGLSPVPHEELRAVLAQTAGTPLDHVVVQYSHTHAGGVFGEDRHALPGGELIPGHLERVRESVRAACRSALASLEPITISYARGRCAMAAQRDYWDTERTGYVCGFNPDTPADDTVVVARITRSRSSAESLTALTSTSPATASVSTPTTLKAVLVNYACHPTTLAWQNTLLSPDFVGALRDEVERATGALCIYAQGACGELGPRHGFVGDPAIADQNGRQVAYAALSALTALDPPETDFHYTGPVESGATLGTWSPVPFTPQRLAATARFTGGLFVVDLPLKDHPDPADLAQDLAHWEQRQQEAELSGDTTAARDSGARAERVRRTIARLAALPAGPSYPFRVWIYHLGDACWIACGGEPYSMLQVELRRRFPDHTLIVSPLAGDLPVGYLLPRDRYGQGLYQEGPASLAPGALETLIDEIAARVAELTDTSPSQPPLRHI